MSDKNQNASAVREKIVEIVSKTLGHDKEKITPRADFVKDLNADSIAQMELLMAFEDEFGIKIDDKEAKELISLEKVEEFIAKREMKE